MNVDQADPAELDLLRAALEDGAPPLGWDAVRAFEAEHGIVLPEPYRTCVAEISDGCEQGPPEYGLVPLAGLPGDWGDERDARRPDLPFPLEQEWVWEADDVDPDEDVPDAVFDHGSLVLGTDGCGMNWHLVVTGPQRGRIWWISGEGAAPLGAAFGGFAGDPGFAGWVAHWSSGRGWYGDA
ncbi:SMI1/KNR4 family protein [Streptomyces sp. cg35]|uniref:SMI1/KNR4 family protein n=1 Tax=Streptomyces sp. cg35 TaxID=3421650 RepID=UPI003D182365